MAGYMLIERKMLKPHRADGVAPHAQEMGFLDYLRELRQEAFPFQRGTRLRVVGFEETLFNAADRRELGAEIHRLLSARANDLERMGGYIQIVFEWGLELADQLYLVRGGAERIALRQIFGNVEAHRDGTLKYYTTGFNLT